MAAPKRNPVQIEKDRQEIANLYLQGKTQVQIADLLGMTQPMISYDLKAIRLQWLKSSLRDFDEAKAQELAKIDNLEIVYWQAWERSLEDFTSKMIKAKSAKVTTINAGTESEKITKSTPIESSQRSEARNGDPRYLQGIQWCVERRAKMLGLDEPDAIRLTWQNSLPDGADPDEVKRQFVEMMAVAAKNADSTD